MYIQTTQVEVSLLKQPGSWDYDKRNSRNYTNRGKDNLSADSVKMYFIFYAIREAVHKTWRDVEPSPLTRTQGRLENSLKFGREFLKKFNNKITYFQGILDIYLCTKDFYKAHIQSGTYNNLYQGVQ